MEFENNFPCLYANFVPLFFPQKRAIRGPSSITFYLFKVSKSDLTESKILKRNKTEDPPVQFAGKDYKYSKVKSKEIKDR